jgi:hypothetical protein
MRVPQQRGGPSPDERERAKPGVDRGLRQPYPQGVALGACIARHPTHQGEPD